MRLEEFEEALDAYGADLARWPESARKDADALLAASTNARAILADRQAIEAALRSAPAPKAPKGLVDRIVQRATKPPSKDE